MTSGGRIEKTWIATFNRKLASDRNFNCREADRDLLGDFFAICEAILYVQADRILDVLDGFRIGITLAVAALKRRAGNEVAVRVRLYDDRKCHISQSQIVGLAPKFLPLGFYIGEQSRLHRRIVKELLKCDRSPSETCS